jgi:hypothetical protein
MTRSLYALLIGSCAGALLFACGTTTISPPPLTEPSDAGVDPNAGDAPSFGSVDGSKAQCEPPDMLIVLDRSASMNRLPNGAVRSPDAGPGVLTKWELAKKALNRTVKSPVDVTLRFGLEVFPDVSGDAGLCGKGTLIVPTGLGQGGGITTTLASTPFMTGTPIGGALTVAGPHLASVKQAGRKQFVLLLTDGGETCNATTPPVAEVQKLAAADVQTFVIGYGEDIKSVPILTQLNNMACAGKTAKDAATNCMMTAAGSVWKGSGPNVFFEAADGVALETALDKIAGEQCCGCVR